MPNEACVLRAATEFPIQVLDGVRRAERLPHCLWEVVEREELKPGFLQRLRNRGTQGGPLLHEGVIGRAGGQAIGGVEQTMVIAFHFGLGVPRTVGAQVLQLVRRAALHPHAVPLLQGVLQAGMAIHDQ